MRHLSPDTAAALSPARATLSDPLPKDLRGVSLLQLASSAPIAQVFPASDFSRAGGAFACSIAAIAPASAPLSAAQLFRAHGHEAVGHTMITSRQKSISVGKYLVSPLTRLTDTGDYAASVSIRSGHGQGTHDRVYRFTPRFATHEGASRYALEQGIGWLQASTGAAQQPGRLPS